MSSHNSDTDVNRTLQGQHQQAIRAMNSGDLPGMVRLCLEIIRWDSQHADSWFLLSVAAEAERKPAKALVLVDTALALSGDNSEYLAQKARYHLLLHQEEAAAAAVSRARAATPATALTQDTLGVVLTHLGEYSQARDCFEAAVRGKASSPQFHFNLASAEQFLGNACQAQQHYEEATRLQPGFARAYWALAELQKNRMNDHHLEAMQARLSGPDIGGQDALYFGHAVARVLEHRCDFAGAFQQLVAAKECKRRELGDEISRFHELFTAVHDAFPLREQAPVTDISSHPGNPSPLFIVGMPRTGTTLVERILTSHSRIQSFGELQALSRTIHQASRVQSDEMLSPEVITAARDVPGADIANGYRQRLAYRMQGLRESTSWHIDKMPLNFFHLGFIQRSLPEARIICVRRNPLDTILSNYRQLFAIDFPYYFYHYSLADTARYYVCFHRLMAHWKQHLGQCLLEINYDELVHAPVPVIQKSLAYLGLDWEPACLDFHQNAEAVSSASSVQVREPLYQNAIGRWRHYRSELQPALKILEEAGIPYE